MDTLGRAGTAGDWTPGTTTVVSRQPDPTSVGPPTASSIPPHIAYNDEVTPGCRAVFDGLPTKQW